MKEQICQQCGFQISEWISLILPKDQELMFCENNGGAEIPLNDLIVICMKMRQKEMNHMTVIVVVLKYTQSLCKSTKWEWCWNI